MSGFKNLRFIALTFYHILAHPAYVFLLKALRSIQRSKTVKTVKYNYLHSKVCVVVTMTFYYYHLSLCALCIHYKAYTSTTTALLPGCHRVHCVHTRVVLRNFLLPPISIWISAWLPGVLSGTVFSNNMCILITKCTGIS